MVSDREGRKEIQIKKTRFQKALVKSGPGRGKKVLTFTDLYDPFS